MTNGRRSLLFLILVFSLIACSQAPVVSISLETPTPVISATIGPESTLAGPTPWVGGTETALATDTSTTTDQSALSTPSTMEKPTDFSPVLYGGKVNQSTIFLLLGGVSRETWLAPDMSVARFSGEATYSLSSISQEAKYFVWGKAPEFSPTCQIYSVGTDTALEEAGFVGVVNSWTISKRPVTELVGDGDFYRQVVIDWLGAEGVAAPEVDSLQVYRVDIEGDGTDEVFISATHLDGSQHTTKAGDYSILLLRQVIGDEAVTKLVVGDIYHSQEPENTFPRAYSFANFIDLNQDGRLEVVVDVQKWEGYGARVYQIDGEDVIQTLGAEC